MSKVHTATHDRRIGKQSGPGPDRKRGDALRPGRMHILIVTNHFWPEEFRVNELAEALCERGHEITVLTAVPDYPHGRFYSGYGIARRTQEWYKGVRVVRVPLVPRGNGSGVRLALNYMSYASFATLLGPLRCRDKYDIVLVFETSPITAGIPAAVMSWLNRAPLLFWVLDLWPESVAAAGNVRSSVVLRLVGSLVRAIYRRCDRILVSSKGFASSVVRHGGSLEQIRYFPNWVETAYENSSSGNGHAIPELPEGFRIIFAGNIGEAQAFPTILAAAELLRDRTDIHWLVLGEGRRADWVRAEVKRRSLGGNFHLLGRYPPNSMPQFFAAADALLVTLKRDPVFSLTVPGKIQSYMRSGRPIIAALDGEGADLIRESGAGMACSAENAEELAEAVLNMRQMNPEEREQMGNRAREYSVEHFDRDTLIDKLEQWMQEVRTERREMGQKSKRQDIVGVSAQRPKTNA